MPTIVTTTEPAELLDIIRDDESRPAWMDASGRPFGIHVLMARVLADLPAIGKDQENTQQHFMYRGIDDAMNALNPVLGRWGVFFTPHRIQDLQEPHRQSKAGNNTYVSRIIVTYRFYGPAGDYVEAQGIGEGTDSLDKASPKSMTGAMKYMLFEVFAISTKEAADTDADRSTTGDPESTMNEAISCPRCQEAGSHWEHVDMTKFRDHMVTKHGYVRQDDGRVTRPPRDDATPPTPPAPPQSDPTPPTAPQADAGGPPTADASGSADASTPTPSAAAEGDAPPRGPENEPGGFDTTWIDNLKGKDLQGHLKERGLSLSGKVDELKERLRAHVYEHGDMGWGSPTEHGPITDAASTDDEPASEPAAGDGTDETLYCPECEAPCADEAAYYAHWDAEHGDGGDDDGSAEDPGAATNGTVADEPPASFTEPVDPTVVADIKTAISNLKGEGARAWARHKRERGWPRLEEFNAGHAMEAIDFLETLG